MLEASRQSSVHESWKEQDAKDMNRASRPAAAYLCTLHFSLVGPWLAGTTTHAYGPTGVFVSHTAYGLVEYLVTIVYER